MLSKLGLNDLVAAEPSVEYQADQTVSLLKFTRVVEQNKSFIVAPRNEDIAFVTDGNLLRRLFLKLRQPRAALGASLQNSRNAVLLTVPWINETEREITPGFISSYPGESDLYQRLETKFSETMQRRDGFLVSLGTAALLDQGYKIRLP